jgi:hypothetical protein
VEPKNVAYFRGRLGKLEPVLLKVPRRGPEREVHIKRQGCSRVLPQRQARLHAVVLVVFGLVLVAAAWLAGHTRPATVPRRAIAPTLRDHPAATYCTVYAALLVLVL